MPDLFKINFFHLRDAFMTRLLVKSPFNIFINSFIKRFVTPGQKLYLNRDIKENLSSGAHPYPVREFLLHPFQLQ